jgi:hypothetical protein
MASVPPSTPTFSRQDIGRAVRQLRLAHVENEQAITAINKAYLNLDGACLWQFGHGRLVVESATQTGRRSYEVTAAGCSCQAAAANRNCWHAAAWRILHDAQQLADARVPKPVVTFDTLTAELDSWF